MPKKTQKYKDKQYQKLFNYVSSRSGTVLTLEYLGCEQYFTIRCQNKHEWNAKYTQLLSKHTWCPFCFDDRKNIGLEEMQNNPNEEIKGKRQCKNENCKKWKPIEEFIKINATAHGHTCKECFNFLRSESGRLDHIFISIKSFIKYKLSSARKRAKNKSLPFDLDLQFIIQLYEKQNGLCALSSEPMSFEKDNIKNISIDRINSNIGYVKENVQLVCEIINFMKLDQQVSDFVYFCKRVALTNG